MDEQVTPPSGEHATMLLVLVAAEGAPAVGTRLPLDYLQSPGGAITVTWLAADPEGAWVVTRRSPLNRDGNVALFFDDPNRRAHQA